MTKKKILIVEDDQSLMSLLTRALDSKKFEVTLAVEAGEGFDKALELKPDLIILDILLPGENGFECLKRFKEHPETSAIPVIILSNLGQADEVRRGVELGAVDYLVKAELTIDEVVAKIEKNTA